MAAGILRSAHGVQEASIAYQAIVIETHILLSVSMYKAQGSREFMERRMARDVIAVFCRVFYSLATGFQMQLPTILLWGAPGVGLPRAVGSLTIMAERIQ